MSESTKHDAIYLQVCDDEYSEWLGDVTWCQDRIHESDVKYIRADLVESLRQQLSGANARIELMGETALNQQKREVMLRDALENCRLLAARHRKEEWATHILRFCSNVEVNAEPLRAIDKELWK